VGPPSPDELREIEVTAQRLALERPPQSRGGIDVAANRAAAGDGVLEILITRGRDDPPRTSEPSALETAGAIATGTAEMAVGGVYNYGVRLAAGLASIPYLLDSADAAVAVQEGFNERFSYDIRSHGAQIISRTLQPVVHYVQSNMVDPARAYAEERIGDAATTALFAGALAAVEIGGVATGAGAFRSVGGTAARAFPEVTASTRIAGDALSSVGSVPSTRIEIQAALRARVEAALADSASARSSSAFSSSTVARIERQQTATAFHSARGHSGDALESHLRGIDFSEPVNPVLLPEGSLVDQWVSRGVGSYFTPVGTPVSQLGIFAEGRTLGSFQLERDVWSLRSTAADYEWPNGVAPGGGTQYFVGKSDRLYFLPMSR
jgi:hypothetical protein